MNRPVAFAAREVRAGAQGLSRAFSRRLSTRIVLLFLGLLLLVQVASFTAIRHGIERNAREGLSRDLDIGERIWSRLLADNAQTLTQGATLLAADYGFRDAATTGGDADTLRSALENHGARIGAAITALLDTQLELRATTEGSAPDLAPVLKQLASQLTRSRKATGIAMIDHQPVQFVMVPMKAPVVIGWVVMGFPVDRKILDDMRSLSGLQAALMRDDRSSRPLIASTLSDVAATQLERVGVGNGDVLLGGEALVRRALPLVDGASVVLLRSVDEAVAPYRQLQLVLAVITALGVVLFAAGSVVTAQRVTTPLNSLVRASEALGRGLYDEPMTHTEREDEIGDLAKAFDTMRVNISAQQREIRQLAFHDRLTGLPNRVRFRDAVHEAMQRPDARLAVVMLDLDRFKHVNDVLGYAFGDQLLRAVAERLSQQMMRDGDIVARLSGDEFAVLLDGSGADDAMRVAERIARAFELPLVLQDQTVDLSAGIGIACWPPHADDADTLLSRAEIAMYAAKRRSEVAVVYDPKIDSGSGETLSLLSELRRALDEGELRLFLQPKLSLRDGRAIAAEALVRWQHPERGMVPPMQFIPFAEQTGFVRRLTLWMFEEAARRWPALQRHGPLRLSVNLSTRDLLDLELPDKLMAIVARHHAPPEGFCLEITESAIMDDPQRAEATLNRLKSLGFKLSIDDFGTGYSSLAYLKRLPVDELKIDKSFVMGMERDLDDAKIVRSTIDLAHNLGLSVVAEGVESAQIWHMLVSLGCDEAQGYHMSKPLPVPEFAAWIERWALRNPLALAGSRVSLH